MELWYKKNMCIPFGERSLCNKDTPHNCYLTEHQKTNAQTNKKNTQKEQQPES